MRFRLFALALLLCAPAWAQSVPHTGTAPPCIDDVDGDISASIQWESDMQGPLGVGQVVQFDLNVGMHVVTASCADAAGNAAAPLSTTVAVSVPDTTPPTFDGAITVEPVQTSDYTTFPRGEITPLAALGSETQEPLCPQGCGIRFYEYDPAHPENPHSYIWRTKLTTDEPIASFNPRSARIEWMVRTDGAQVAQNREIVIMRVRDPARAPVFEAVLTHDGTSAQVAGRVHTSSSAQGYFTTLAAPIQGPTSLRVDWSKVGAGLFELHVGGMQIGSSLRDFEAPQTLHEVDFGVVEAAPDAFTGWLDFDSFVISLSS